MGGVLSKTLVRSMRLIVRVDLKNFQFSNEQIVERKGMKRSCYNDSMHSVPKGVGLI